MDHIQVDNEPDNLASEVANNPDGDYNNPVSTLERLVSLSPSAGTEHTWLPQSDFVVAPSRGFSQERCERLPSLTRATCYGNCKDADCHQNVELLICESFPLIVRTRNTGTFSMPDVINSNFADP